MKLGMILLLAFPLLAPAADDPAKIEAAFAKRKGSAADWTKLLEYYNSKADTPEAASIRDKRVELIAALAQREDGLGDVWGPLGRAAIYREGDAFASPEGYERVKALLAARCKKWKHYGELVWFLYPEEPEAAIKLATEHGHSWDGALASAQFLLGIRRKLYQGVAPDHYGKIEPGNHSTPLGQALIAMVRSATSPIFLFCFAENLRSAGAQLWAAGKLDWDYTGLANQSLQRAMQAEADRPPNCGFHPVELPARGATVSETPKEMRPVKFVVVKGGQPVYPPEVVRERIQGTVADWVLVGCSGRVIGLDWVGGPPELRDSTSKKLAQYTYEIRFADGQSRQVLTYVTNEFKLSR